MRWGGRPGDFGAAVRVDRSEWDDPDYEVLAFVGRDRPFERRECGNEPGECVDKVARAAPPSTGDRIGDTDSGMTEYGSRGGSVGYAYHGPGPKLRPALAMDMAGFDRAERYFMAFPGEEPPQIECNEDASGEGTDE